MPCSTPTTSVPGFSSEVIRRPGVLTIVMAGNLDLATVGQAENACRRSDPFPCPSVVLDLRALTFIDACGLALVLRLHARAGEDGGSLLVTPPTAGAAAKVMRLLCMDRHVAYVEAAGAGEIDPRGTGAPTLAEA